ncbi:VgrG protein, partial [hydrothermal vent metagenome]
MAQSPSDNSSEVLKITLSVDGKAVEETVNIARIVVKKSVNRIPRAVISILDGDMPSQEFKISDTEDFIPGKKIEIGAGYGAQTEVIFSGIITQHSIDIRGENESTLIIECKDEAVKMTVGRKNENYIKQTAGGAAIKDKTVISGIIGDYSGLSVKMAETTAELSGLVQYNATDWDFMVSRAEANAMLVMVSDGVINIEPPDLTKAASLSLVYGDDIFSFNASLDSLNQYKKVTSVGWDLAKHSVVEEPATANQDASSRGSKNGDLAKVVGLDNYRLQSQTPMAQQSLKEWAASEQLKSQLALLTGVVRFQGVASAAVGEMIELTGV